MTNTAQTNPYVAPAAVAAFLFEGSVNIQLTAPSAAELRAQLALFGIGTLQSAGGVSAAEKAAVLGNAEKPKPTKAKVEAAAPAPAPADTPPSADTGKTDAPALEYQTLYQAVVKLAAVPETGRATCAKLLAKFCVKTFKDLAADRWQEALDAVNAELNAETEVA